MSESVLVSIIVVNFNGKHFLKECFDSLKAQSLSDFEIILVDNNSTDDSLKWLQSQNYSFVKTVKLNKNYGFGIANNKGFESAVGKYILILNNDTVLDKYFLERIVEPLERGNYKIVAPLILYKKKPLIIDKAGGHLFYPDGLNRGRGCGESIENFDLKPCEVFYPDGCAAIYDREIIEKNGFFDEDFFLYGEDTDLGLRYRIAGNKCFFVPNAIVYHVHSGTAGKFSPQKAYYVERNRVFVIVKNFPLLLIVISPVFTIVRYFFQGIATLLGKGVSGEFIENNSSFRLLSTLLKADCDALKMIPVMWKKRKRLRQMRKVGFFEFCNLIFEFFLSPIKIAFKG